MIGSSDCPFAPSHLTDANRPKSEEEKRNRTLESKRRWARKNRAEKSSGTYSARKGRSSTQQPTPSFAGSDDDGDFDQLPDPNYVPLHHGTGTGYVDDEEGDSSFDTGSVGGWRAEGPPGLARGDSAPLGAYPSPHYGGAGAHLYGSPHYGHQFASASNPFYPHANLYGTGASTSAAASASAGGIGGRRTPTKAMDPYLAAIAAAAADQSRAQSLRASSSSAASGGPAGGGSAAALESGVRRSSRRAARTSYAEEDEDDEDEVEGEDTERERGLQQQQQQHRLPQLAYHSPIAGHSNPYSQPFHHYSQTQEPSHGPPLGHQQQYHHLAPPGYLSTSEGALSRPLSPSLISAAASAAANAQRTRTASGGSLFPTPYDMPGATPVSPGGSAPVAIPYYARRQSPARVITGSGIAAGIPAPTNGSDAHAAAVTAQGGLESPVKLRRTGSNGRGKEAIHRPNGGALASSGSGSGSAGLDGVGQGGPHREDAAGILLALKAGPSSPMASHVQSPVSSVRGSAATASAPLGRARRIPRRRIKGGNGDFADPDSADEHELGDGDDEDDEVERQQVQNMMLRPPPARPTDRPVSPWRAALQGQSQNLPAKGTAAEVAEAISPRKRGRSESPAPMLASTSSGEGGSAEAAHALLATAKKAHQYAAAGGAGAGTGPAWNSEMSLVATPTPGNMMRLGIESSPVVRFGGANGGGAGGAKALGGAHDEDEDDAIGDAGDSEGDMLGAARDGDDDEGELGRGGQDAFTSSSGGGRRSRRGASLGSSGQSDRRRRGNAGGSSSSGGGAGASSSSAARPLHHHHPVGLSSELGDFNLQPSSSSSGGRAHHHHDPLREDDAPMPGSSSSTKSNSHLVTPAPAATGLRRSVSANGPLPPPQAATHPHDPFLAAGSMAGATMLPLSSHALGNLARTSSPPGGFSSYLFSSPAHPQFSKTLGLTAAPGPGVMYTGVGGETPARGGSGSEGLAGSEIGGPHVGGSRVRELSGSNTSGDDDGKSLKTPVMGRILATSAGLIRRGGPATSVGMPASDVDSMGGEDESETTGTGRDESQSPGKATVDGDYDDDDSEA